MTRLSNRQYPMLKMFFDLGPNGYMSEEDMKHWDQRPFRSMLIQKWVAYRRRHGFHITDAGLEAMREFESTDIATQKLQRAIDRVLQSRHVRIAGAQGHRA